MNIALVQPLENVHDCCYNNLGSGILGQTAQIWHLKPSRTHSDMACFDGPFCRLVAGLSDRDENGDNQLLFLEIKMFWLLEPVEELGGQMVVWKRGMSMCQLTHATLSLLSKTPLFAYAHSLLWHRPAKFEHWRLMVCKSAMT